MSSESCPFCDLGSRVVASNDHAVAVRDLQPASPGHTLIVPRRHTASFFDLSPEENRDCYLLLREQQTALCGEVEPSGFNVGVNVGAAAGQKHEHTLIHLIPRYDGDHPDPRGGVRHVIPTRR